MDPAERRDFLKNLLEAVMDERRDSIEIGSASKGGAFKVYVNANNIEEAKKLIDNMVELRNYASGKVFGNATG